MAFEEKLTQQRLEKSINRFLKWLNENGYESYDVYDFWSSPLGIYAKKVFNKNKYLAAPLVGSIQILDSFFPKLRFLFSAKKRFALADAQIASGFLNYYEYSGDEKYLDVAKKLLNNLRETATKTESGIGWGLPYRWVTTLFEYPPNTPLITVTPYCFDAFLKAYEITNNQNYLEILKNISNFVAYDMKETEMRDGTLGSSYGPNDNSLVYNAVAYRSSLLLKAGLLFENNLFINKAKRNIDFVVTSQNQDGSWFYSANSKFIDNFHTCFVLKNIAQTYSYFKEEHMLKSLLTGYAFYKNNFIRTDGTLKHFYKSRYPKFRKIELYDYAEAVKLGVYLKDILPDAYKISTKLSLQLIKNFQTPKGYFLTRVNLLGGKNKIPYLRWPQAQIFYALTHILMSENENIH